MTNTTIGSIRSIQFWRQDQKGVLTVFPGNDPLGVPFPIARVFTIAGVPSGESRANHAHRGCSQLLVCLSGSVEVLVHDGFETVSLAVESDGIGVLIPPLLWNTVTFQSPSTVLMVICDEHYDAGDYIRDWDEYLRLKRTAIGPASIAGACPPEGTEPEELWQAAAAISQRIFGYVDEYHPYRIMYPWVLGRLAGLKPGSHILDLGAGVSPLPLFFAERNCFIDTVDRSTIVRRLPTDSTWNGWGYLDYSAIHPNIASYNCEAGDHVPRVAYDAAYAVGMIAHLSRAARERLVSKLANWLMPGAGFVFTVDVVKSTNLIWNKCEGKEIEPHQVHGTVNCIRNLLESLDYQIHAFDILRDIQGSHTDIVLVDSTAPLALP